MSVYELYLPKASRAGFTELKVEFPSCVVRFLCSFINAPWKRKVGRTKCTCSWRRCIRQVCWREYPTPAGEGYSLMDMAWEVERTENGAQVSGIRVLSGASYHGTGYSNSLAPVRIERPCTTLSSPLTPPSLNLLRVKLIRWALRGAGSKQWCKQSFADIRIDRSQFHVNSSPWEYENHVIASVSGPKWQKPWSWKETFACHTIEQSLRRKLILAP